jgi:hypothetical protein
MKRGGALVSVIALTTFWLTLAIAQPADSIAPAIGAAAPAFSNKGTDGRAYSLDSLQGQWIVLEW